jgi:hypothetical protein
VSLESLPPHKFTGPVCWYYSRRKVSEHKGSVCFVKAMCLLNYIQILQLVQKLLHWSKHVQWQSDNRFFLYKIWKLKGRCTTVSSSWERLDIALSVSNTSSIKWFLSGTLWNHIIYSSTHSKSRTSYHSVHYYTLDQLTYKVHYLFYIHL